MQQRHSTLGEQPVPQLGADLAAIDCVHCCTAVIRAQYVTMQSMCGIRQQAGAKPFAARGQQVHKLGRTTRVAASNGSTGGNTTIHKLIEKEGILMVPGASAGLHSIHTAAAVCRVTAAVNMHRSCHPACMFTVHSGSCCANNAPVNSICVAAGCYDALSGKVLAEAGHKAAFVSGYAVSDVPALVCHVWLMLSAVWVVQSSV